jgi:UV DNA damage endonuclease
MIRFGLCCKFEREPIKFYTTTATSLMKLNRKDRYLKLSNICMKNAKSLQQALFFCADNKIGSFRVNSQILPVKTYVHTAYEVKDLPLGKEIIDAFKVCKKISSDFDIRTTFHPDQFILLSSANEDITDRSIADLNYQAEVSDWIGADVINIHGGGAYGNKAEALARVAKNVRRLSSSVRKRLTFENDDKTYTPHDLLPLCIKEKVPLVYDVHHHRCNPDEMSIEEATQAALKTWNREPLFHISSPKEGWSGPKPSRHHDYIAKKDFPTCWKDLDVTIEVEAKAKELAIKRLANLEIRNQPDKLNT